MRREDLKPSLQRIPKWLLVILHLMCFPIFVIVGMLSGVGDFVVDWGQQLVGIWCLDEQEKCFGCGRTNGHSMKCPLICGDNNE